MLSWNKVLYIIIVMIPAKNIEDDLRKISMQKLDYVGVPQHLIWGGGLWFELLQWFSNKLSMRHSGPQSIT